jgi:RNA polymerase sigma-70 factor (ECF subfamily)
VTEQEWLTIYRETVHILYLFVARRTGGNRELSEDIVQESYLRALNDWKSKSLPDSPAAWLKRVAQNILIDYLRQRKWTVQPDVELHPDAGQGTSTDQVKSLEIALAISSLGRRKAKILEAFYYDGKSEKEIATEMNISERAVEGLLRRARRSLKALFPDIKSKGGQNE